MAVYYIGSYDVTDSQSYDEYVKGVIPLLMKHGCEIIVADREAKKMEGESRNINLVLKFETQEQALAWYHDPDYQPIKGIRVSSTTNSMGVLAKAFQPPE